MKTGTEQPKQGREGLRIWGLAIVVAVAGVFFTFQFVEPPPPRSIVLATGSEQGAYFAYGNQYREHLAEIGIDVEVRVSAGSIENLGLLEDGSADVAFVQSGTVPRPPPESLIGLAGLYYEPLWVFCRPDLELAELVQLKGRRVQIGKEGSGTRAVAQELLSSNRVTEDNTELLALDTSDAVEQLYSGQLDALFLVASPRSSTVRDLMKEEGDRVKLMDVGRAPTYLRLFRYLREVIVTEGLFDLVENRPNRDIRLLSPTAQLLASDNLHKALIPVLIETAKKVHGRGDLFEAENEFPTPLNLDAPLADQARHHFRTGPSFLYRVLPFRLAAALDRLKILLLPLLTLLLPLVRIAPPLYRWRIRSKIFRWYKVIRSVEERMRKAPDAEQLAALHQELNEIEEEIHSVRVPPGYMEEYYNLRMHLDRLRTGRSFD